MKWIRIRSATTDDLDAIMALEESCFTLPWRREDLEIDIRENILSAYFVAETSGQVCGYAGMWMVCGECHIMTIAVAPGHRQAGIGAMLFMKLMDEARLRGANRYFLEVRMSNAPAIAMYEKFGFRRIDVRRAYYDDNGEDALIMCRDDTPV
ncbi:MAG: ribosomal protein S18-alanine N-acetyltransferase [Clostridiales Family XIII bacterium]|jgi:ribosomal-protein-alanine N-acetyltransferase|nr:ribosomal protein S18-alanine N-acetyltransferase [Clostridiales Family XIII bacterium]